MTNKTITATEAKNRFAELVDLARIEPVTITRNDRAVAIVLSPTEYSRLLQTDDTYWGELANKAKDSEFLTTDKSASYLSSILNVQDKTT